VRLRGVHWLLSWHHPVAVDAAAACVDVHAEQLLMLMPTAVAAGPTGIATAGIARLLLTHIAGSSIVSAVVVVVVGMVINEMWVSNLLLMIHRWRTVIHQSVMIFFSHHCPSHHLPRGEKIGLKLR
jgi:hypothetical protein